MENRTVIRTYWDYKAILEILDLMEFEVLVGEDEDGNQCLKLHDLQGANLGGIESDTFEDFDQLIGRMDVYFDDYIVRPLEEEFENEIGEWDTWFDMYNRIVELPYERIKSCEWDINMLGLWIDAYYNVGKYSAS